jgi:hypothetical protein
MRRERVTARMHCPKAPICSFRFENNGDAREQRMARGKVRIRGCANGRGDRQGNPVLSAHRAGTSALAKALGLRHSCRTGDVAEWLKAAVC